MAAAHPRTARPATTWHDRDGDGLSDGWEYWNRLNPLADDSGQPASRANYTCDAAGWLRTVYGARLEGIGMDAEGNVTHDLDGNMTSGPWTNDTFVSYTFDARNRLTGVSGLTYGFDALGNRTSITNGTNVTRFVVNPNAALSQVLMRIRPGGTNYYIYAWSCFTK